MSFRKPTRLGLAMHEAGHACAFAAIARRNEPNEIGPGTDNDGNHHGWCNRNTLLHMMTLSRVPVDVLPHIHRAAAAEVVVAISGPMAEFRHRHRNRVSAGFILYQNAALFLKPDAFDTDGDFQRIRNTFDYIQPADPVTELRRIMDISEEIVAANWPSITRLGRQLLTCELMKGKKLRDWFQKHQVHSYRGELNVASPPGS